MGGGGLSNKPESCCNIPIDEYMWRDLNHDYAVTFTDVAFGHWPLRDMAFERAGRDTGFPTTSARSVALACLGHDDGFCR
jgi:hypothetical protein